MLTIKCHKTLVKKLKIEIIDEFNETKVNFLGFNIMNVQFSR